MLSEHTLARVTQNLADIGAIAFDDYLDGKCTVVPDLQPAQSSTSEPLDLNAVTRLHQACQRAFRNTDALKFEFIEQGGSRYKQCILTITKPDGVQRSYATQSVFVKKNEAKSEAAKIAIDMGALDFLTVGDGEMKAGGSAETSSGGNAAVSDALSVHSDTALDTTIDDIEQCCLEWRAGRVTPQWVPFFDAKLANKQGCALRIRLSPHVVRVYLSDPTFDTHLDAKGACAKVAVFEGVLDFIKHGNGQTCPSSPHPSSSPATPLTLPAIPWTLQGFYDSLPRPFPESFTTSNISEINALGWLNTTVQNARGGKLLLSFFFTSDGPPGLHGCLLKLDRPGEYKVSLVDARFPKRSDAKAAVCLQAMSEGVGNYIRSIASAVEAKVTPMMRSFSSGLVYPALASELSKINADLHPHFEYDKERDAFGATMVVRPSTSPTAEQIRRYTVSNDYRNKADAKTAVICHAAEQGVVEFVRFRGRAPPDGYTSPYTLRSYNPDASRKRKQPGSVDDAEQDQPAKKKKKKKWRGEVPPHDESNHLTPAGQRPLAYPGSDQIQIPGMGSSRNVPVDGSCDPSQQGVGSGGRSSVAYPGASHQVQTYASSYHAALDPRFAGSGASGGRGYSVYALPSTHGSGSRPPAAVEVPLPGSGLSGTGAGTCARGLCQPAKHAELEPGEVASLAESEFSESSSRNEDDEVLVEEQDVNGYKNEAGRESVEVGSVARGSKDKGKGKETFFASTSTTVSREDTGLVMVTTSHVKKLIDYCATHRCGTPSFHERERQGRFQVWIVIGQEQFDLPTTYGTMEEGQERVARQVLARLSKRGGSSG